MLLTHVYVIVGHMRANTQDSISNRKFEKQIRHRVRQLTDYILVLQSMSIFYKLHFKWNACFKAEHAAEALPPF